MEPTREKWNEVLALRHGSDIQAEISRSKVAICGLGGLGSNIAVMLARAGVGKLILIDFDSVDLSNIHRQQYKIGQIGMKKTDAITENTAELNPYIEIETHCKKITESNAYNLLKNADIICEAVDDAETKAMIADVWAERLTDKYLVSASGMAGFGDPNNIKTRKITSRFFVCGDGVSGADEETGIVSSGVTLCAAHQAHTVLRIIANCRFERSKEDKKNE